MRAYSVSLHTSISPLLADAVPDCATLHLGYNAPVCADPKSDGRATFRHCERSEAIQNLSAEAAWIASSQGLLAMTVEATNALRSTHVERTRLSLALVACEHTLHRPRPSRELPLPCRLAHVRLEAVLEAPVVGKLRRLRIDASMEAGEVRSAQCRRLLDHRAIDRGVEEIGEALH